MKKVCSKCKIEKHASEFGIKSYNKDGLNHYCKLCENERSKQKYSNPNHKERVKYNQIKRLYKLSKEDYLEMFINQNHSCKICGCLVKPLTKNSHVDHCHKTNKIRGILCGKCNTLLGSVDDDVHILKIAIDYLITA